MDTVRVVQRTLDGGMEVAGLTPIQRQLAQIMWDEPETQRDEDLLAARWLIKHGLAIADSMDLYDTQLARILRTYRKLDLRRRRQELRHLYPYGDEEERRRQKRAKGGPP